MSAAVSVAAFLFACSGNHRPADSANSATAGAVVAGPADGGLTGEAGPATTTAALGESSGQGSKLAEATGGTTAPLPDGAPPKGQTPHSHDPGRGPADIRAIVVAHRDEARACYDRSLADHPGVEGDLVIQWTIDPKGKVTQVSADLARSQISDETVVACVGNVIRRIQFAESAGGFETKAFYPFNFHPHHGRSAGSESP